MNDLHVVGVVCNIYHFSLVDKEKKDLENGNSRTWPGLTVSVLSISRRRFRGCWNCVREWQEDRRQPCWLSPQRSEDSEQIVDVLVSQDDVLEALRLQVLAISHEIQRTRSDVESGAKEFCKKRWEIRDPGPSRRSQGFDPCLLLNEQMGVLMVEEHGFSTAFDQLTTSERWGPRQETSGAVPVLQSLKENFEVVRLVPLQEQDLTDTCRAHCTDELALVTRFCVQMLWRNATSPSSLNSVKTKQDGHHDSLWRGKIEPYREHCGRTCSGT